MLLIEIVLFLQIPKLSGRHLKYHVDDWLLNWLERPMVESGRALRLLTPHFSLFSNLFLLKSSLPFFNSFVNLVVSAGDSWLNGLRPLLLVS